jgi:hypothetical protein
MLVPMTVSEFHLMAMLAVTLVLLAERLAPPGRPRWQRPPVFEVLARLLPVRAPFAQA